MQFKSLSATAAALALLASAAYAVPETVNGALLGDTYSYSMVSDGGTRDRASVFAYNGGPSPMFAFNYHDSMLITQWSVALPGTIPSGSYEVTSARIEVYNSMDDTWNPTAAELRLFDAGFAGAPFTEATWTEATPYAGPGFSTDAPRYPFPIDLITGTTAEDDPSGTEWSTGSVPGSYTGVPANDPDEAFKITFTLDVGNPTIQNALKADFTSGLSTWVIASSYEAAQPPTPSFFPHLITKEGVSNASYGTAQQAPALIIEVEEATTAVDNWAIYN